MRIDKIHIKNFRGIEDLEIDLNPNFNLIIGDNGSGKTAILEALTVGMGSFFLGIPGVPSRVIRNADIRYFKTLEGSYEYADHTLVNVKEGVVNGKPMEWYKERNGFTGRTLHGNDSEIKAESQELNNYGKNTKRTTLLDFPVLAYYSTGRLWKEGRDTKKDEKSDDKFREKLPSRYRAYKNSLDITSTFKIMLEWFESKFQELIVNKDVSPQLECVRNVVIENVPNAVNVKWVFDRDKLRTLYITFKNGDDLPFTYLSDGFRNLLAIFADLAYRCVTLNPHFGSEANIKTHGIVLIDELDLHLHPAWQQDIVKNLKKTFPNIQFVATTHSPFIIQEMDDNEVYHLKPNGDKIDLLKGTNRLGIEDIAEDIQKVVTPNMSSQREEMFKAAEKYYQLLDSAEQAKDLEALQALKDQLDSITEKYSDDVAYYAFLKQERLVRGIK